MLSELPDAILFDDNARTTANRDITAVIDCFGEGSGGGEVPEADAIAFACETLMILAGRPDDVEGRAIVSALESPAGVRYSMLITKLVSFQSRMRESIERARAERIAQRERSAGGVDSLF